MCSWSSLRRVPRCSRSGATARCTHSRASPDGCRSSPRSTSSTRDTASRGGSSGLRHPKTAFWGFTWTTLSWIVTSFSFWIATLAFDLDLPVSAGILILTAVGLSLVLPAAPGALGVFEAAVVLALSAYDVPRAEAVSFAFALHALNFFPYLLSGVIALRFTRRRR